MIEILWSAIADLADRRPRSQLLRTRAALWIMGANAALTFATACNALGLDPRAVREALPLDPAHVT